METPCKWSSGGGALQVELCRWSSGGGALQVELCRWSSGGGALQVELRTGGVNDCVDSAGDMSYGPVNTVTPIIDSPPPPPPPPPPRLTSRRRELLLNNTITCCGDFTYDITPRGDELCAIIPQR